MARVNAIHAFSYHVPRLIAGKPVTVTVNFRGADMPTPLVDTVYVDPGIDIEVPDEVAAAVIASGAAESNEAPKARAKSKAEDEALA